MTIAQLEEKLTQNPASPLFARLADEYLAAGKIKEARALCVSGLQQFSAYPTAYLVLARCCDAAGDTQSALDSISIALQQLPFTPLLHDFQVELTEKSAPASPSSNAIAVETTVTLPDEPAQPPVQPTETLSETPVAEIPAAEIPGAEIPAAAETQTDAPEETEMSSSMEMSIDDGMMAVTPLEDELRKSLEEHLHEVLDGDPVAEVPAELPTQVDEIPAETAPAEEITPETTVPPETPQDNSTAPEADVIPSAENNVPEEATAEIEQFFNERISEIQVESLPEAEAKTDELPSVIETPVEGAPPAAEAKPAYVPPPPIPEEADPLDETTSLGVDGRIVSRTLAEIYVMQGAIAEAILTYQLLKLEKPALRAECDARIRELEPKLQDKPSL